MFSINLTKDGLACSLDDPNEVAGGVDVGLHFHQLVMVGGDEGGYVNIEGVHWWSANGHDACTVRAGWVEKEGVVGDYLAEGGLDEEDSCGRVDNFF